MLSNNCFVDWCRNILLDKASLSNPLALSSSVETFYLTNTTVSVSLFTINCCFLPLSTHDRIYSVYVSLSVYQLIRYMLFFGTNLSNSLTDIFFQSIILDF